MDFPGLGGRKLCREREGNIVAEEQISYKKAWMFKKPDTALLPECYWVCVHFGMELL